MSRVRGAALAGITIVVIALAILVANGGAQKVSTAVVYLPVLDACEEDVIEGLENMPSRSPFVGSYVPFDNRFRTHPRVAGFIKLESSEYPRERLVRVAGGYTLGCVARRSESFQKADPADVARFFEFLRRVSDRSIRFSDQTDSGPVDSTQLYILDSPEELRVYFNVQ